MGGEDEGIRGRSERSRKVGTRRGMSAEGGNCGQRAKRSEGDASQTRL